MEKIDEQWLKRVFGTEPELIDLYSAKILIDEWIIELEANEKW